MAVIIEHGLTPEFKRRQLKRKMVRALRASGMDREASMMDKCQKEFMAFVSPVCGCVKVTPISCGIAFCPDCGLRRRVRLEEKVKKSLARMDQPRLATLTIRNVEHIDGDTLAALKSTLGKLRRTKRWLSYVTGGEYTIEITWSLDKFWHPHIHVLMDGFYYPQAELSADWKAAGGDAVVDIRKADKNAAAELCKYISKGHAFVDDPQAIKELYLATAGKRLHGSFGEAFKWNREMAKAAKKEPCLCEHEGDWEYSCKVSLCDVFLEDGKWKILKEIRNRVHLEYFDKVCRAA